MECRLPLSALLSQVLVAFAIEFDNEFEHRVPHRTTNYGSTSESRSAPWLVSMTMWLKFMRFVPGNGIPTAELQQLTGLSDKAFRTWLTRMSKWWGYVSVSEALVRPTAGGLKALAVWHPLTAVIEGRWKERFDEGLIDRLRQAMQLPVEKFCANCADYLPILGYELLSRPNPTFPSPQKGANSIVSSYTLPMLLSKILLAFAFEFERNSNLSLAIGANALRLTGQHGVRVRDLPGLSGVSKEAVAMLVGRIEERGLGIVQPESPGSRARLLALTPEGQRAQRSYHQQARNIEKCWAANLGKHPIGELRELLEQVVGADSKEPSPLFKGLQPYPDGWRASVPKLEQLPHYPMVLHRGGFPDGS